MKENTAALRIQGIFASYQLKKQHTLQQAISQSPHVLLLQALDLRFQCMRAVAAAKFLIYKPIEDKEQATRVIKSVIEFARDRGITNLEAIAALFQHNILLAENIQSSYYDLIWRKSGPRDMLQLVNSAYAQLRQLVIAYDLPILFVEEKVEPTSTDVLALARFIIQYASTSIIGALASPTLHEMNQERLTEIVEEMLGNYMTPSTLSRSNEAIHSLTQSITSISVR